MHSEIEIFRTAWSQLQAQWGETSLVWNDEVRRSFEGTVWRGLKEAAGELEATANRLGEALDRAFEA